MKVLDIHFLQPYHFFCLRSQQFTQHFITKTTSANVSI